MSQRISALLFLIILACRSQLAAADRPNILWITSEDNGPHLGCYGDEYATTPNLDAFAEKSCRYLHCWSNAPVCAPARTAIITGMYPTSLGAEHMRSMVRLPEGFLMYPQYLREAGYYCTNNSKEDYNVEKPGKVWDESSRTAHWKNRAEGQPFFAIFNLTISHESQIRNEIDEQDRIHDPDNVRVPAYHPDTPEVRKDWAQYYDRLTMMDAKVGETLRELEEAGLADETIVFYYGDHGSGMPRNKRWPYNSGLHVPLLVHIPEKWRDLATDDFETGGTSGRLVSFVDLAPTLLSLCGIEPPEHMQGHAFLGEHAAEPQPYIHGFRGRMDERYDMVRSVTDGRYVYIRNYMPHRIYGQYVSYMFQTPTTRVWKERFDDGELDEAQSRFWQPKPPEELYDLESDPDEVINLVESAEHRDVLERMREALVDHLSRIVDLGFFSEYHLHAYSGGDHDPPLTRYEAVREYGLYNPRTFHFVAVYSTDPKSPQDRIKAYLSECARFRPYQDLAMYWAVTGILGQGGNHFTENHTTLRKIVTDSFPDEACNPAFASTKILAAEALAIHGDDDDLAAALPVLMEYADVEEHGLYAAMYALNALDHLDRKAAPLRDQIDALPRKSDSVPGRLGNYVGRLIDKILADLD